MKFLLRMGWSALVLAAALGGAAEAAAISASSANYVLERHAFTGGNPNSTNPVASANFVLAASSLGGMSSQGAATNAARKLYSGYLVPWSALLSRPNLTGIFLSGGTLRLEWAAVAQASRYTVEHAATVTNFLPVAETGLTRWDSPAPSATSRFYRVRAWSTP
ncbi:MAG: hypothetical protein EOM10_09335 [Opitutae bacterium]|nr:hypothetical protein [Opitutae bacterium]